uniref:Chemosensory protein n=1 Tax=Corythucha ciliata TaxID=369451 RepID=A0A2S0M1D3_CORCT|nr:chemosensory protein [Corythucha ciliata]
MKVFVALAVFLALASAAPKPEEEQYSDKYDNVDLDEILNNDRLYKNYYNCLINKGHCSPDAKELKDALPDALQSECKKCTKKQKEGTEKVAKFFIEHHKEDYNEIARLYDPQGIYYAKYKDEAAKRGIVLT